MGENTALLTGLCFIALCAFDARAQEGDATAGAAVFKRCAICHVVDSDKNKVGPSLRGLFGKKAGTHPGFAYSVAMRAAGDDGLAWNETTLRGYLHNPKTNVVGTKMGFPGLKDDQAITDLISYLKQYSE
ncbi:c-type cytochrome [Rhizobium leguminosarum]|uniref:c-type cytochrome n=1 Tax=Rhizobium leguminosarum TaxID=384 RepID=UPI003F9997E6